MEQNNQTGSAAQLATVKTLRNKAILWAAMALVLMVVLVYLGVAWYTRISSTHAVTFDVADYDLAYNDNTENEFLVNIYNYSKLKDDTVAPGTAGYIPLKISGRHTEIDVEYTVTVENMIMPEMGEHIRLYYLVKSGTENTDTPEPAICDLDGNGQPILEHSKFFLTDPTKTAPTGYVKKYIQMATESADGQTASNGQEVIKGTIKFDDTNKEKMLYIYWEWFESAEKAASKDLTSTKKTDSNWSVFEEEWDKIDTKVGRFPDQYKDSFLIHLKCSGAQSTPELNIAAE